MSGDGSLSRDHVIAKGKINAKLELKNRGNLPVDEYHALVSKGGDGEGVETDEIEVVDVSSGEEEETSEDSESDDEVEAPAITSRTNGTVHGANGTMEVSESSDEADVQDDRAEQQEEAEEQEEAEKKPDDEADDEPSFGDLLRANGTHDIDVAATLASFPDHRDQDHRLDQTLAVRHNSKLQLPVGISLSTVLTQSLRTNDRSLLESCFQVHDLDIIRATIERLDSALAASLLEKLTARLHRRPGRAGSLMVWIQWTLVAHGGYLAAQPSVTKRLATLHRVVQERASSLPLLLALKGKLDMLEAQLSLRRGRQSNAQEDDEEAVIYVEGQESSEEEDPTGSTARRHGILERTEALEEDEMDVDSDSAHESSEGSESDQESSDDASEVDDDLEPDDVDHEDLDTNSEDASDADGPPAKLLKLGNGYIGRD